MAIPRNRQSYGHPEMNPLIQSLSVKRRQFLHIVDEIIQLYLQPIRPDQLSPVSGQHEKRRCPKDFGNAFQAIMGNFKLIDYLGQIPPNCV
ncbi:MAG: hypothetical protein R3F53_00910 [Gammaproteobacteria bacterium]